MRETRLLMRIPVAAGQSESTLHGVRDLIVDAAIDVCNFDASWSDGPTVWRKAAAIAAAFGVQMAHHEEPQVSPHLLASVPDGTFVECFDEDRDPIFWNLLESRSPIENGTYALPPGAGFGIELNMDFVDQCTVSRRVTE